MFGHGYDFSRPRWGDCAGCGCNVNLNDHRCPEIVRINPTVTDEAVEIPVSGVNTTSVVDEPKEGPSGRQLADLWLDTLTELGVYA